jgi:2,3-bisphosphoglycerate-dependent phosphoglycerate mutase
MNRLKCTTTNTTDEAVLRINQTTVTNILDYLSGKLTNIIDTSKQIHGKLILVRHTESEYNKEGLWTGTRDVKLTEKGFEDARLLGETLRNFHVNRAYASEQVRTMETLSSILGAMQQPVVTIVRDKALNERDYGEYTGKSKHEMKELLGDEMFELVRRGWDVPIPGGETLKNVYDRIVPFYNHEILPNLLRGENILIVSHGNALRALVKYIENIDDTNIQNVEMIFGGALVYTIDDSGRSENKEVLETPSAHIDTII